MSPPEGPATSSVARCMRPRARRILIVDDHPLVRHGLRGMTQGADDLEICGESGTASEARAAIVALEPDVLVCDIGVNQFEGIELIRTVRAHHPGLPILVLSHQDETLHAERMLAVGANGYIMKDAPAEELIKALRRVLDGQAYVSETVSSRIIFRCVANKTVGASDPMERLTPRELQILLMIGEGLSTRETAQALHLSVKTVESHRQRIRGKLNLRSGAQLVRFAMADVRKRSL